LQEDFEQSSTYSNHATFLKRFVNDDACAKAMLRKVPWVLDWSRQTHIEHTIISEAARLAPLAHQVKFSFVVPLWNTPPRFLRELLTSIRLQTWPNWEAILVDDSSTQTDHLEVADHAAKEDHRFKVIRLSKNLGIAGARNIGIAAVSGHFVGFIDHDDLVHPQAFGIFARTILEDREANFLFSNEVKLSEDSARVSDFLQKPDFSLATLIRVNYIAHLTLVSRDLLATADTGSGTFFRPEFDGVEDHDLFLRLAMGGKVKPRHIPLYCYYWRKAPGSTATTLTAKPKADDRAVTLLRSLLEPEAAVTGRDHSEYRSRFLVIRRPLKKPAATLLVVVPFRDQPEMTISCLASLIAQETPLNVHIVAVSNLSSPDSEAVVRKWMDSESNRRGYKFHLHRFGRPFNYAEMNNEAILAFGTDCDLVLLLNNDVELTSTNALTAMASELQHHADIGFVGIKLWYPGRAEVQHGGLKVRNVLRGPGYFRIGHCASPEEFVHDDHVVAGVTFACAMTRMETWNALGGLETSFLPNGFGDIDLCLRAQKAGFSNFYLGTIEGIHHESKTRGESNEDLELQKLYERNSGSLMAARVNFMAYNQFLGWNGLAAAAVSNTDEQNGAFALDLPLRYRLADSLNNALKTAFRPLHGFLKAVFR